MDYNKLRNCELFLFDMDGTLYLGDEVYDGAREMMFDFPRMGKKYIYLTNNSSRAGEDYIHRLRRLGFPCERENVFTSGMATGMYLNQHHPGASVYLAGLAVGYWKSLDDIRSNWAIDRVFTPAMDDKDRHAALHGWHKAVRCALTWADEDEDI